jgi:hypothetical protein
MHRKYVSQAQEVLSAGDIVDAEKLFQAADHYYRLAVEKDSTVPAPKVPVAASQAHTTETRGRNSQDVKKSPQQTPKDETPQTAKVQVEIRGPQQEVPQEPKQALQGEPVKIDEKKAPKRSPRTATKKIQNKEVSEKKGQARKRVAPESVSEKESPVVLEETLPGLVQKPEVPVVGVQKELPLP